MEIAVIELCNQLEMDADVIRRLELLEAEEGSGLTGKEERIIGMTDPARAAQERVMLKKELGEDPDGMRMLLYMLHSAAYSGTIYKERKIPETVFFETMKCFSRFVREHRASYGRIGFDRDFWVTRQLSLRLFRLGALEFEIVRREDCAPLQNREEKCPECRSGAEIPDRWENVVCEAPSAVVLSVHIPSDARLTKEQCSDSYEMADTFFAKYFPELNVCGYVCDSWLLSPALKELVAPRSNILRFQSEYEVLAWDQEADDYLEWVFRRKDLPVELLPEDTSLQRSMKRYLLGGGRVGAAFGIRRG